MQPIHTMILPPVNGYSVLFLAYEEDMSIEDSFSFGETGAKHNIPYLKRKVKEGKAVWFCAEIRVSRLTGIVGGANLGGCYYNSYEEFYTKYKDDYLKDLIDEAIQDARINEEGV